MKSLSYVCLVYNCGAVIFIHKGKVGQENMSQVNVKFNRENSIKSLLTLKQNLSYMHLCMCVCLSAVYLLVCVSRMELRWPHLPSKFFYSLSHFPFPAVLILKDGEDVLCSDSLFYPQKVLKKLLLCGHAGLSSCMQQLSQVRISCLQFFHIGQCPDSDFVVF